MTIPRYKKSITDKMTPRQIEIANEINAKDKKEITRMIKVFLQHRDLRGNWMIPQKNGLELLPYFKKYVDPNVTTNIFGCGGCAKKMVDFMFNIYKIWQNPIK